jgi:hypothetical protein
MSLTLSDLDDLRRKTRDPIVVGELPNIVCLVLQLKIPLVHFSHHSLDHIKRKHPDISDFDLLLLPFVIKHGLILRERRKRNVLLACYQPPMTYKRFVAVMKIATNGYEIWLDSFHRTAPAQTARLMRKAEKLKNHD